jgi:olefin beta-lactone synthetase
VTLFANNIMNLAEVARGVAQTDPERTAVIEPKWSRRRKGVRGYRRFSYASLSADAESVAVGLREIGVAEGTRTVFMAPPCYDACVLALALTRVGATTLWIDPAVGYLNVGERLRRIKPEAFVGVPLAHLGRMAFGWGPRLRQTAIVTGSARIPGFHTIGSLKRTAPAVPAEPDVSSEDPAMVLYTTGSTGPAKPVLYNHRQAAHIYHVAHESWRFRECERPPVDLAAFPAFAYIVLSAGGTAVVPPIDFARQGPGDADPEAVLQVINDCKVSSMFASPALLENIARYANSHGVRTPTLRRVIGGGAPIYDSTIRPLLQMVDPSGDVLSNYGATEVLPATELSGKESLATWDETARGAGLCVGRPFPGVDVQIMRTSDGPVDSIDSAAFLEPGKIGEVVIHSRHVSPAYLGDKKNTDLHKIPGKDGCWWHRTRDAGYLDTLGRLWYVGRVSQCVKIDSGTLYPLQVEPVFNQDERVRRSALVGVGPPGQTRAVLCVQLQADVPSGQRTAVERELLQLAAASELTRPIRSVLFHPKFPVDPRHNSKIDRPSLARWAEARVGRELAASGTFENAPENKSGNAPENKSGNAPKNESEGVFAETRP